LDVLRLIFKGGNNIDAFEKGNTMSDGNQLAFWSVSLHGEVRARLKQILQFDDDIGGADLAVEEATFSDHTGPWVADKAPAIVLSVEDELAVHGVSIFKCRAKQCRTWEVIREASIMVRTVVTVQAATALEAKMAAEIGLPPETWRIYTVDGSPGAEVLIGTPDVLESVYASNVTPYAGSSSRLTHRLKVGVVQ
jgi:hypothetical protein